MATDQERQIFQKGDKSTTLTFRHCDDGYLVIWRLIFLQFWYTAVDIMYELQFFIFNDIYTITTALEFEQTSRYSNDELNVLLFL